MRPEVGHNALCERNNANPSNHDGRCISDAELKDECAEDFGGCWRQEFTVNGKPKLFNACHDNIEVYKARPCCTVRLMRWGCGCRRMPWHKVQGITCMLLKRRWLVPSCTRLYEMRSNEAHARVHVLR